MIENELFTINCFWFGSRLRWLEQVCLLSMLRQGHTVRLFSYDKLQNVPDGIDLVNAEDVMPVTALHRHRRSGSASLGSNIFRYRLMSFDVGIWLDIDMLLLAPIEKSEDCVFGFQDDELINGAVLFIPSDNDLLGELLDFTASPHPVPPFYPAPAQQLLRARQRIGSPVHVRDMNWGVFGPQALTYFAKETGADRYASAKHVFYPVYFDEAHRPFMASWDAALRLSDETLGLHLWNQRLRRPSHLRPDNPMGRLIVEQGSFVEQFASTELGYNIPDE